MNGIPKVKLENTNIKRIEITGPSPSNKYKNFEIISEGQNTIVTGIDVYEAVGTLNFTGQGSLDMNYIQSNYADLNFKSGSYTFDGDGALIRVGVFQSQHGGTISFEDGVKFYAVGEEDLITAYTNITGNNIYASADKLQATAITTKGSICKVSESTHGTREYYTILAGTAVAKSFAVGYVNEEAEVKEVVKEIVKEQAAESSSAVERGNTVVTSLNVLLANSAKISDVVSAAKETAADANITVTSDTVSVTGVGNVEISTCKTNDSKTGEIIGSNEDFINAIASADDIAAHYDRHCLQ